MTSLDLIAKVALDIAIKSEIQKFLRKRTTEATSILIEEMRIANIDPGEAAERDDVIAMMVSFYLAMAEGAAFKNLRLIAKILAGKAADPSARTDDFIMWKEAIASLTREEAILLATLHKHWEMAKAYGAAQGQTDSEGELHNAVLPNVRAELTGPEKLFAEPAEFTHAATWISRTGFVSVMPVWGGVSVVPTGRLAMLATMANLQAWADETTSG